MAILATLFAYDGWILMSNIAGELKNTVVMCHAQSLNRFDFDRDCPAIVTFGVYRLCQLKRLSLQNNATFAVTKAAFGDFNWTR